MEVCYFNRCKYMGDVSHLVLKLISASSTCVGLISCMQFSPDDGVLLDKLNISAWWGRRHVINRGEVHMVRLSMCNRVH